MRQFIKDAVKTTAFVLPLAILSGILAGFVVYMTLLAMLEFIKFLIGLFTGV